MGTNYLEMFERLASSYLRIHQNRCIVVRNRHAMCRKCAKACAGGAIKVNADDNEIVIEPDRCVGCGTCASVCPTSALEALNPTDIRLVNDCLAAAEKAGDGSLAIACERACREFSKDLDMEKAVCVVCLGRVDESLLANLAVRGVTRPWLVRGDCENCELARGAYVASEVLKSFNALMGSWNFDAHGKLSHEFPQSALKAEPTGFDASKRALFTLAREKAGKFAAGEIEGIFSRNDTTQDQDRYLKVGDDGTLPQVIPSRREFLLDALASMELPDDGLLTSRLWGHVVIDPSLCTGCRACVMFCPTGALRGEVDQACEYTIKHRSGQCVKCRCCENICRRGAIKVCDDVRVFDITEDSVVESRITGLEDKPGPRDITGTMRNLIGIKEVYDR